MAEFENLSGGAGDSASPGKKKGKFDKKKMIMYGALGIFAFVLISSLMRRSAAPVAEEDQGNTVDISGHNMPTNSVDTAAQMQSIQQQLLNTQTQQYNGLAAELSQSNAELVTDFSGLLKDTQKQYEDQLKEKTEKFNEFMDKDAAADKLLQDQLKKNAADLAAQKKAADAAKKKAATDANKNKADLLKQIKELGNKFTSPGFKSPAKPVVKKPAAPKKPAPTTKPKTQTITIKKGDTLSELAVKYKTSVNNLMKLNPYIKDKNKIYYGKSLRVK